MNDLDKKPDAVVPVKKDKRLGELSVTEKRALVLEALEREGYSPYQAAQLMGVSKQLAYRIDKQMRQGILAPLIYKARKSIGLLADGQIVGKMEKVTGDNVIAASRMIIDRYEPVIQKIEQKSFHAELTLGPEERQKYLQMLGMVPQIEQTAGPDPKAVLVVPHEHAEEKK
jgi:transposase